MVQISKPSYSRASSGPLGGSSCRARCRSRRLCSLDDARVALAVARRAGGHAADLRLAREGRVTRPCAAPSALHHHPLVALPSLPPLPPVPPSSPPPLLSPSALSLCPPPLPSPSALSPPPRLSARLRKDARAAVAAAGESDRVLVVVRQVEVAREPRLQQSNDALLTGVDSVRVAGGHHALIDGLLRTISMKFFDDCASLWLSQQQPGVAWALLSQAACIRVSCSVLSRSVLASRASEEALARPPMPASARAEPRRDGLDLKGVGVSPHLPRI